MINHFDLLVLGGGSGGLATAQAAAICGAKVALIEGNELGGTCVNRGCVPKKIMWHAAELVSYHRSEEAYGYHKTPLTFNFSDFIDQQQRYIHQLQKHYEQQLKKSGILFIKGIANFIDSQTVAVNQEIFTARHIVIATGSYPRSAICEGAEYSINSDDFFNLKELPQKIAIVGAGYIAVELASILNQLGSQVTLLLRYDRPLRNFDVFISNALKDMLSTQGIKVLTYHVVERIEKQANSRLNLHCQENKIIKDLDAVLFAIGRDPRTKDINLAATGVKTDKKGFIITDKWEKTNVPQLYAIGDITGKKLLTPVAIAAGRCLALRIFGSQRDAYLDYSNIPTVIFSHPPMGSIGLSEEEAIAQYGKEQIIIYKTKFNSLFYALQEPKLPSFIKMIALRPNEKIIGCHFLGKNADEILQGFAVAIKMGATKKDLDSTVAIHPTSAEELVTL